MVGKNILNADQLCVPVINMGLDMGFDTNVMYYFSDDPETTLKSCFLPKKG